MRGVLVLLLDLSNVKLMVPKLPDVVESGNNFVSSS